MVSYKKLLEKIIKKLYGLYYHNHMGVITVNGASNTGITTYASKPYTALDCQNTILNTAPDVFGFTSFSTTRQTDIKTVKVLVDGYYYMVGSAYWGVGNSAYGARVTIHVCDSSGTEYDSCGCSVYINGSGGAISTSGKVVYMQAGDYVFLDIMSSTDTAPISGQTRGFYPGNPATYLSLYYLDSKSIDKEI